MSGEADDVVLPAESAWSFAHRDPGSGIQRPAIARDKRGELRPVIGSSNPYATFVEFGETPYDVVAKVRRILRRQEGLEE